MKRVPAGWWIRLRNGLRAGGATLVGSTGLAGAVIGALSATGTVLPMFAIESTGIACLTLSAIVTLVRGKLKHLPDQVIDDGSSDGGYIAEFCSQADLSEANGLTRPYYRHEYVTDQVAESWRRKNEKGFVAIRNKSGELCASFGILALERSFMDQFIKGRLRDNNLEPDDVMDLTESRRSERLYISGVVVRNADCVIGNKRACVMVWAMIAYIQSMYGSKKRRTVYALAVSKESENLLKGLGFTIASPASSREDRLNLYSLEITRANAERILSLVGDYSKMCRCRYTQAS